MNLYQSIMRHLDGESSLLLGKSLNEKPSKVEKGFSVCVPIVLRALSGVAQTEQGSRAISATLGEANTTLLYDFNSYLTTANNQAVSQAGNGQLDELLLAKSEKLTRQVSQESGLSRSQSRSLIGTVSALTIATAATKLGGQRSDRSEIAQLFDPQILSVPVWPGMTQQNANTENSGTDWFGTQPEELDRAETETVTPPSEPQKIIAGFSTKSLDAFEAPNTEGSREELLVGGQKQVTEQTEPESRTVFAEQVEANDHSDSIRYQTKLAFDSKTDGTQYSKPATSLSELNVQAVSTRHVESEHDSVSVAAKVRRHVDGIPDSSENRNSDQDLGSQGIENPTIRRKPKNTWPRLPFWILGAATLLFFAMIIFEVIPGTGKPEKPASLIQKADVDVPMGAQFGRDVTEKIKALKRKTRKPGLAEQAYEDSKIESNAVDPKDANSNEVAITQPIIDSQIQPKRSKTPLVANLNKDQRTEVQTTAKVPVPNMYESTTKATVGSDVDTVRDDLSDRVGEKDSVSSNKPKPEETNSISKISKLVLPNGKYARLTADKRAGILLYQIVKLANKMDSAVEAKRNRHEMQHHVWRLEQLKKQRSNWPAGVQAAFDDRLEVVSSEFQIRFGGKLSQPDVIEFAGPVFKRFKRVLATQ